MRDRRTGSQHYFVSAAGFETAPALFKGPDLLSDVRPVVRRDVLPGLIEQTPKVMQAGDRSSVAVVNDGGILAQAAEQNGSLDIDYGNAHLVKFGCKLLVGVREGTLDTTPLQECAANSADIAGPTCSGCGSATRRYGQKRSAISITSSI